MNNSEEILFIKNPDKETLSEITQLLKDNDLSYDSDIEETLLIRIDGEAAATGSISGNVLKCIAVSDNFKSRNLTGNLLTRLISKEYQKGNTDLFLFTKPKNSEIFGQLGFFPVYEIENNVVLMENNMSGLDSYIETLKSETLKAFSNLSETELKDSKAASIVVNCNPITIGHLYLIEKAAAESEILHLFVVEEDRSVFPFSVRFRLVREATAHIKNLVLHSGSNYIISNSTFPSYFIKDSKQIVDLHARLDLGIFSEKIAPSIGIKKRYAGDEPLCPVTSNYNRFMSEILPSKGVEFEIIKRLENGGVPVSASRVRKLLADKDYESIKKIVPEATYNFLISAEGDEIRETLLHKG